MEKDVHQMKSPWLKSEEMIIQHIDDMHHRPVVIGGGRVFLKLPDAFGKDLRDVFAAFNPVIPQDLAFIVIDKIIQQRVGKNCKCENRDDDDKRPWRRQEKLFYPIGCGRGAMRSFCGIIHPELYLPCERAFGL